MRIQNKLFFVLLATSMLLVALMYLLIQWSLSRGMLDYVNDRDASRLQSSIATLAGYYREQGDWESLRSNPRQLIRLLRGNKNTDDTSRVLPERKMGVIPQRLFRKGPVLLDVNKLPIVGRYQKKNRSVLIPINVDDVTVGWLAMPRLAKLQEGIELRFLRQQQEAFIFIAVLITLIAAAVAFFLARHFLGPINRIARVTHQLTQGHYKSRLPEGRGDELGSLSRDFNKLAKVLENNEQTRKRWLADISHELRTPLSILRGEIEAMLDGVRAVSNDNLRSAQQEAIHLGALIDDLYFLSSTDVGAQNYHKETIDLVQLLQQQLLLHKSLLEAEGIQLQVNIVLAALPYFADSTRISQLFDNLFENSRKYTDSGGVICVDLKKTDMGIFLIVEDSAPAVSSEALPHLFEYLYRADPSRNRASGGSGLGLSICQRIVEGHQGSISAKLSIRGGLKITVRLPLESSQDTL